MTKFSCVGRKKDLGGRRVFIPGADGTCDASLAVKFASVFCCVFFFAVLLYPSTCRRVLLTARFVLMLLRLDNPKYAQPADISESQVLTLLVEPGKERSASRPNGFWRAKKVGPIETEEGFSREFLGGWEVEIESTGTVGKCHLFQI